MDSTSQSLAIRGSSLSGHTASETPAGFPLFSSFPVEIQCKIFKAAFPEPRVVYFDFKIVRDEEGNVKIYFPHRRVTNVPPFLLACQNSNGEFFRNYQKLEIHTPYPTIGSHASFSSVYIHPKNDIFVVRLHKLYAFYVHGGYINFENLTQLALGYTEFLTPDRVDPITKDINSMRYQVRFYTFVSNHCPALKKLYLLISYPYGMIPYTHQSMIAPGYRIIDITEGCLDLSYEFIVDGKLCPEPHSGEVAVVGINKRLLEVDRIAKKSLRDFDRFLKTTEKDKWTMPTEKTLKYWKNLRPSPAFSCFLEYDFTNFRFKIGPWKEGHQKVYVETLEVNLAVYSDGTPLDIYKGLAQIFDGAPW
ncbi:hypothetical protein NHQ30_004464 [Ciborinia camelliae]|nr:hypothetical protein NHQ30_004464 [Ciborinia camelliae]